MTEFRTITAAAAALRTGETTARELVETATRHADDLDGQVGVFIRRYTDSAREAARRVDERIARGELLRPLDGIPIGIKDIFAESQGPTTAQSLVLDQAWADAIGDAVTVARLKDAGGIVMGKLTTMEFAMGAPDASKPFPIARNAWDVQRWAGGSSSGSASGVAAGMFLGALGTDTAGSVRIPAAYNGVTGLKPTYGLVPASGLTTLAFTQDHVGPIAHSAADAALLLNALAGADDSDPSSVARPRQDYTAALTGDLEGVRIGYDDLDRFAADGIDPAQPALFQGMLRLLDDAGARLEPISVPMYETVMAVGTIVMMSEAVTLHRSDLRPRWDDYTQALRVALAGGSALTAADYLQAQRVRRIAIQKVRAMFARYDLVVTPTAHRGAMRLDDMSPFAPLSSLPSVHTLYWDPLGNPTVTVPIGLSSEGTPLGASISAAFWADALVLRAADAVQRRSTFHLDSTPLLDSASTLDSTPLLPASELV